MDVDEQICVDEAMNGLRHELYSLIDYPFSAFDSLKMVTLLEKMDLFRNLSWQKNGSGYNPYHQGIAMLSSYFKVMADAKSEQEHQDAFCTPIIEVP